MRLITPTVAKFFAIANVGNWAFGLLAVSWVAWAHVPSLSDSSQADAPSLCYRLPSSDQPSMEDYVVAIQALMSSENEENEEPLPLDKCLPVVTPSPHQTFFLWPQSHHGRQVRTQFGQTSLPLYLLHHSLRI